MDTDPQDSIPTCAICMGEYDLEAKQAVYTCGPTFHWQCLTTALSASTSCPVCRTSPSNIQSLIPDCEVCQTFISADEVHGNPSTWSLAPKCGHIHHVDCSEQYLVDRQCPFPPGPTELEILQSNPDMKGCISCQNGHTNNPDAYSHMLYEITPSLELPEFLNLGMNTPGQLPRRWPETVLDLNQLLGTGARPSRLPRSTRPRSPPRRPRSPRPTQLSGANSLPLGARRYGPPTGERLLLGPRQDQQDDRRGRNRRDMDRSGNRRERSRSSRNR